MKLLRKWRRLIDRALPTRRLTIVKGDSLPSTLPRRNLVLAQDEDGDWCVGMRCPCGCGYAIELMLIREVTFLVKRRTDTVVRLNFAGLNAPTAKQPFVSSGVRSRTGTQRLLCKL